MLEDQKPNTKVRLALLWVALMFFYIYNDIFSIWQPEHVQQLMDGELEGVEITQSILFGGAALMAIPSLMILLSLTLKATVNRVLNIAVGVLQLLVLLGTQFVGESGSDTWLYWRLFEVLEAVFLAIIIWTAWTWPHTLDSNRVTHHLSSSLTLDEDRRSTSTTGR